MLEWRVARVVVTGQDGSHRLAEKLNEMAQGGWDIDGMEIIGRERDKMVIVASKEKANIGGPEPF